MSGLGDGDLGEGGPGLTGGVSPVGGAPGSPRTTPFREVTPLPRRDAHLRVSPSHGAHAIHWWGLVLRALAEASTTSQYAATCSSQVLIAQQARAS